MWIHSAAKAVLGSHVPGPVLGSRDAGLMKEIRPCSPGAYSLERGQQQEQIIITVTRIRTSLVVQWLRICLPTRGSWVWSLVWEDPTCCGATKSNAATTGPADPEPALHEGRSPMRSRAPQPGGAPRTATRKSLRAAGKIRHSQDETVFTNLNVNFSSVQFSQSVVQLCDLMECSTSGLPVHHQLPEFAQTHVHWVGDAIQPSHPLLSPSPPALNLSQHQSLFKWVSSSHQVAKVLEFQFQHQSF